MASAAPFSDATTTAGTQDSDGTILMSIDSLNEAVNAGEIIFDPIESNADIDGRLIFEPTEPGEKAGADSTESASECVAEPVVGPTRAVGLPEVGNEEVQENPEENVEQRVIEIGSDTEGRPLIGWKQAGFNCHDNCAQSYMCISVLHRPRERRRRDRERGGKAQLLPEWRQLRQRRYGLKRSSGSLNCKTTTSESWTSCIPSALKS